MIMVGLAFKLSAVPFHFWCPDVFEGAVGRSRCVSFGRVERRPRWRCWSASPSASARRLRPPLRHRLLPRHIRFQLTQSLSNNLAAEAKLQRQRRAVLLTPPNPPPLASRSPIHRPAARDHRRRHLHVRQPRRLRPNEHQADAGLFDDRPRRLHDHGRRRRRAAWPAATPAGAREAVAALMFYLVVYVFMNLGAFAIVAFLRNAIGSEEIADYAGLIRSAPVTSVALTAILVSLIGIPPMVGFIGKFAIFNSLVAAGGPWMIGLLVIAGINTAISLIYYLRVAKVVCIDPEPTDRGPVIDRPGPRRLCAGRRAPRASSTASSRHAFWNSPAPPASNC